MQKKLAREMNMDKEEEKILESLNIVPGFSDRN